MVLKIKEQGQRTYPNWQFFHENCHFLIYFISKPITSGYFDYTNTKEPESHKPVNIYKVAT
jgi:hypothetical protein